jgi:hypothetical protein
LPLNREQTTDVVPIIEYVAAGPKVQRFPWKHGIVAGGMIAERTANPDELIRQELQSGRLSRRCDEALTAFDRARKKRVGDSTRSRMLGVSTHPAEWAEDQR